MEEELYGISALCRTCGIGENTIKRYEAEGLIRPRVIKGKRFYSAEDIERIMMIRRLTRDLGVNLAGVEVILNMREQMVQMQKEFERIISDIRLELSRELMEFKSRMYRPLIENRARKIIKVEIED